VKKTLLALFSLFIFVLSTNYICTAQETGPFMGDKAIDFTLKDLNGKNVKLSEAMKGKTTLMFFWASWCRDSKSAMPTIIEAYKKYDPKKLLVIGVNTGVRDSVSFAKDFQKDHEIKFKLVFDKGSLISNQYMVMGTPRFFVINKSGVIIYASGAFPKHLKEMLNAS